MPNPTCATCRHWKKCNPHQLALEARTIAPHVGECHRFPPRESGRAVRTDSTHCCGEWAERPGAAAEPAPVVVQAELAGVEGARPRKGKARP